MLAGLRRDTCYLLSASGMDLGSLTPEVLSSLPARSQEVIAQAMVGAMLQVFLIGMLLSAVGLVLAMLIRETPLLATR